MTTTYPGLVTLNGNLLCSIDYETTGLRDGYHEVIQVALVPVDSHLNPLKDVRPFYTNVKPEFPERQEIEVADVHALQMEDLILQAPEQETVKDMLYSWFKNLDLPLGKKMIPLAHNWSFEARFSYEWLGVDMMSEIFHPHARDAMQLALAINDRAALRGMELPFARVGLGSLCNRLKIHNPYAHDALYDAFAEIEVYKRLLMIEVY